MSAARIWTRLRHVLGHYPTTAREWAVRAQSPDVTRQELLALDEWLRADPRNAEAYARIAKIGHLGLLIRDLPEPRARLRRLQPARPLTIPRRWSPLAVGSLGVAAALALVFAAGVLVTPARFDSAEHYLSRRGEQRQVALSDGSRMIVNPESDVAVRFGGRERIIDLAQGEAFFEVAKDVSRPFVVRTPSAEVRALGTRFSVSLLGSDTRVVVTEGRVRVAQIANAARTPSQVVDLGAGSEARVLPKAPTQVALVDAARVTAWTSGNVEFDEAPLAEVIADLNRYSRKRFVIADPELSGLRLTGRFRIGDVESVKFALGGRFDIRVTEDEEVIRLSR